VALAALSLLAPSVPTFDPWAWIVWGREVLHLQLHTLGGPSWKPLPVLFTTAFALFGGAAPALWLVVARAGGLLAFVFAFRLAARLSGGDRVKRAGAGLIAVIALALSSSWLRLLSGGLSEPLLAALVLGAIDRHLDARFGQALALAFLAALVRPEAWPFLAAYGLVLWFRERRLRPALLLAPIALGLLWFGADWWGSGNALNASHHALTYPSHLGRNRPLTALRRGLRLLPLPFELAALAGLVSAAARRERPTVALAAGALGWAALVSVMTLAGYPGLERFFLPAAGVICVLAGVGTVRILALAEGTLPALLVLFAVIAVFAFAANRPLNLLVTAAKQMDVREDVQRDLRQALKAAGGRAAILGCRLAAVNFALKTGLAWYADVPLRRVRFKVGPPALLFRAGHGYLIGGPPKVPRSAAAVRRVARAGPWTVVAVSSAREPCRLPGRPRHQVEPASLLFGRFRGSPEASSRS
jgi:hypothetical protein